MSDTPRFIVRGRFVDPNGVDLGPAPKGKAEKVEDSSTNPASLPDDFPERDLLIGTAFKSTEALNAATDEDLLAVDGIGPAKLKAIREALKGQ